MDSAAISSLVHVRVLFRGARLFIVLSLLLSWTRVQSNWPRAHVERPVATLNGTRPIVRRLADAGVASLGPDMRPGSLGWKPEDAPGVARLRGPINEVAESDLPCVAKCASVSHFLSLPS